MVSELLVEEKIKRQLVLFASTGSTFRGVKSESALAAIVSFNHFLKTSTIENLVATPGRNDSLTTVLNGLRPSSNLPNYGKIYLDTPQAKAVWIVEADNRTAEDPIVFYLHGGGFVMSTGPTQVQGILNIYEAAKNPRLSVLAVEYSLSPEATYPIAISQSAYVYNKIVVEEGNKNVILLGDSAGGNLSIVLLKHIATPIAAIEPKLPASSKPKAAILSSPWLELSPERAGSYVENDQKDALTVDILQKFGVAYQPDEQLRKTLPVSPVYSKPEDWEGVMPEKTLIIGGQDEVMVDDIHKWVNIAGQQVNLLIEPLGAHDTFGLDFEDPATYNERFSSVKIVSFLSKL
ncbi:hypothetical protein BABINDRAFT_160495 [Babjeviella inositovora NRRL Y-12698]|uniref:Alpha/beta hydrolase fold-3 domain-containing protein n=1 Tax=Babjeviella inositovora NRRL Y-12698 TaxID=984486 RepID=A0A1E3QU46_9ASCO|nr:uncharacterized protein BABINDRAFT_160495 [Babjeviella inositovora NRRL Y-12698]ODQ81084.1 hypothetical protein BABINDRAFT_160495 [Babjeviella inositovora NRRL Y-12698]